MKTMKGPGLFWCLVVAFLAALLVGTAYSGLWLWFEPETTLRLLAVGLPLAYVGFLVAFAGKQSGRVVLATFAAAASGILFVGPFALPTVVIASGALVWLVRVICYHRSPISAAVDGALALFGMAAAIMTFTSTHSVAAAVWVALLTQCLFVYIPDRWTPAQTAKDDAVANARFDRAFRAAEAALRDLAVR